nr:uncharacterized protein LOC123773384 isoform X2 [Procambarus clarkii]
MVVAARVDCVVAAVTLLHSLQVGLAAVGVGGHHDTWVRNDLPSPYRRPPSWVWPSHEAGRRKAAFTRPWVDATPNSAFPPRPPHPPRALHTLTTPFNHNNFITDGEDYEDEDATHMFWLPQSGRPYTSPQHSASLQGLQHLLEDEVRPGHPPVKANRLRLEADQTLEDNLASPQGQLPQPLGRGLNSFRNNLNTQTPGRDTYSGQLPVINYNFQRESNLRNDLLRNSHSLPATWQRFTGSQQSPDFLVSNTAQFPQDFDRPNKFSKELPPSDQYLQTFPEEEPLQTNFFDEDHLPRSFGGPDVTSELDDEDFQDQMTIPEHFMEPHTLQELSHQQPFLDQEPVGGAHSFPVQQSSDLSLPDGHSWIPSSLSGLNLPSSKDVISVFTNPELTKEGQREACHARNLHTCGSRVIREFNHERAHAETCTIREEFLDCMEHRRDEPCRPSGVTFSRSETKLIRDKIKLLLWSARGCILGLSA